MLTAERCGLLVSAEYESKIYREACVLLPVSGFCQLDQLVNVFEDLHAEELEFTQALSLLEDRDRQPKVAWGGAIRSQTTSRLSSTSYRRESRDL